MDLLCLKRSMLDMTFFYFSTYAFLSTPTA